MLAMTPSGSWEMRSSRPSSFATARAQGMRRLVEEEVDARQQALQLVARLREWA
jgi:hypothetical protein